MTDIELDPINKRLVFTVSGSRSVSVKYEPSSALELTPYTDKVTVGEGNRQATYTFQLYPAPLPGTVRVEFMYLGDWYTLDDNATGELTGDATGTINYSTGSGSISLPAEPDLGSAIIYTWAQSPYYTGDLGSRDVAFEIPVAGSPVQGTMEVAWSRGGINYTATADANDTLSSSAGEVADGSKGNEEAVLEARQLIENFTMIEKSTFPGWNQLSNTLDWCIPAGRRVEYLEIHGFHQNH